MANITELQTLVAELQASLDAEQTQIAEAITALEQTITDLEALVAEGGTQEQRQALFDQLTLIKEDLESTIPDAEPPVEPVEPV